jgi:Tfp pilus assembly protein PilO
MSRLKELLEKLQWSHVAVLVILATAYFFYSIDPTEVEMRVQGIGQLNTEITNLKQKIQEAKDFEAQFADKKKRYAELVNELQKIQGALPKQFFLPDLLSDLLREAKQLELEITSIKADPKETTNDLYNSWGFDLSVHGTFLQYFIFLDRLANLKRLVSVENFHIERDGAKFVTLGGSEGAFAGTSLSGGKAAFPEARGTIRVITYRYRGAQAPAPDAGEPAPPKGAGGNK